jgi:RNA polymerase sigma-70 factor (ECF subfamily)
MQDNKLIKALVLNAQLGNNSAFEQLYQITIQPVYTLILRLTGDSSTAEALTKKTYVNSWQKISQKDEFTSILDWLKKNAVETVLAEINGNQKTAGVINDKSFQDNPLETYIQNLEFRNRLIYILHDIENFSIEEISKLSGISDDEIKNLLASTRDTLINLIEE